ncbi:MAG: replication-associated recombination protein A [Candidatus Eisenbacteria bacterium]
MSEDLFGEPALPLKGGIEEPGPTAPLADRMRPRTFEELVGQQHILAPGSPVALMRSGRHLSSIVLWGPPGTGKTTLARLIARTAGVPFVQLSAVLSGIKEVKEVMEQAARARTRTGKPTLLFVDEIHRFNKAQQDAFLAHVERGDIVLIGATTENPSFEVNSALLSRARVLVLKELQPEDVKQLLVRALASPHGLAGAMHASEESIDLLAAAADGDARRALTTLEIAAASAQAEGRAITADDVRGAMSRRHLRYDRAGEEHFNLISALHKSLRDSDVDGSLYWFGRMVAAGEDALYIARRLVRFASEDVGEADPQSLLVATAAFQAFHQLGSPEGELALAQVVVHLAQAPKSNAVYVAYKAVMAEIEQSGSLPPPLVIRNAPTKLMKELGYGSGYAYAPDDPKGAKDQQHLPDELLGKTFFPRTGA